MSSIKRKAKKADAFEIVIIVLLSLVSITCLLPLLNVLAESLSQKEYVVAGKVTLWPINICFDSYTYVLQREALWRSMLVTLQRVAIGLVLELGLSLLTAYPLSKSNENFTGRTVYAWFLFFTTLFSGGTIAWYMNIKQLHLLNSIWALTLPNCLQIFYVLLILNFYRAIPKEMEEAAIIDGASQFQILARIYIPTSLSVIATVALYIIVGHWNEWFAGIVLMSSAEKMPLSSYLRTVLIDESTMIANNADWTRWKYVSDRTIKAAQMFIALVPIMAVYPLLQKYFIKGIMIGAVKG